MVGKLEFQLAEGLPVRGTERERGGRYGGVHVCIT